MLMKSDTENKVSILRNNSRKKEPPAKPEVKRTVGPLVVELVFSVLLLAAICALRTVQVYAQNVDLLSFEDLGSFWWICMISSIVVFAILRIFIRKPYFACIFVAVATFFAVNFQWLVALFGLFIQSALFTTIGGIVLFIGIMVCLFFLLRRLYKKGKFPMHIIVKILSVTFTCLILFNVVMAFIAMGKKTAEAEQEVLMPTVAAATPAKATPAVTPTGTPTSSAPQSFGKPNIYFFILDEYSSFDMLSKYYGYDAKVFSDFLTSKGFNISRESYSTDNETEHAICDRLNMDYISRHLSKNDCMKGIYNAPLHQILTDMGYKEYQIANSKYFKGIESLTSDSSSNGAYEDVNMFGDDDTEDIASDGSISDALSELFASGDSNTKVDTAALNQLGFYPSDYIRKTTEFKQNKLHNYADSLLEKFDYFENSANYNFVGTTPRVTYAYMTATHVPFIFNEYGGIIPWKNNRNWEDTNVYLNQYKFINKHLMASVSTIIKNDPDSIIIIMSDHGIRYHHDCKKKHTFYITDKDSCRIMNAVYIKGQQYNIEGLSGINTMRYILSLYDGLDYPPLKDPITSDSPDRLKGIIPKPR